jgi:hypothetical protein
MEPFQVFCNYLALKSHFTNPKYDYFKYNKKVRASLDSYHKRSDRYFFEKVSRKYKDKEIVDFFVSNFVSSNNSGNLWIGEIINSGEKNYIEWMKRQQSLTYLFKEQSAELFSQTKLDDALSCIKGHPVILKKYLSGSLYLENLVIYDKILNFSKDFDKKLLDPIWETVSLKIHKYKPFINIDVFQYKKLLRDIVYE